MLNTNDPRSADILAAARQTDMILQLCKVMTLNRTAAQRQYTLRICQPAFAALRWLNAEQFGGSREIDAAIGELQAGAATLANLPTGDPPPEREHRPKACPACGTPPITPGHYPPTPYCSKCLNVIMPALSKLGAFDGGFGLDGI